MEDSLLLGDTLLYISMAFIAFGVKSIETMFWQGAVALVIAAGIVIVRAYLKKKSILAFKKEIK